MFGTVLGVPMYLPDEKILFQFAVGNQSSKFLGKVWDTKTLIVINLKEVFPWEMFNELSNELIEILVDSMIHSNQFLVTLEGGWFVLFYH
mgnify:CR=1 FL=1